MSLPLRRESPTDTPDSRPAAFVGTIFDHLERHPEKAFVTEVRGETLVPLRGGDLLERVARMRGALRAEGVRRGDRVALIAPNGHDWVAADLAMLAEAVVSVPLYHRQSPNELVAMMRDAGTSLVLCADEPLAAAVREHWDGAPIRKLDELGRGEAIADLPAPAGSAEAVTLIYTSGTSGEPKGVVLTGANVDHMLPVTRDALREMMGTGRGEEDRVFHYLPFCFAGSRIVLWTGLFRGGGIRVSTDLNDLARELKTARPHYLLNVPALLERIRKGVEGKIAAQPAPIRALYARGRDGFFRIARGEGRLADRVAFALARAVILKKIRAQIGPDLVCLICGSAPLAEETQRWFEMLGLPVYQVYGLTETTAIVTMDRPSAAGGLGAIPGRVGWAIPGVELKIGDDDELLVRGPNVFPGYWGKPRETEAVLAGEWLRTGDQVELDGTGNLRIVGRVKNLLVPTSGHNVAPEPIEQAIVGRVDGVTHAVVVGHARPHLVAIVAGTASRAKVVAGIDAINAELPHYRRVRAFHLTSEPFTPESGLLTANQKLKRKAIEAHFRSEIDRLYAESKA